MTDDSIDTIKNLHVKPSKLFLMMASQVNAMRGLYLGFKGMEEYIHFYDPTIVETLAKLEAVMEAQSVLGSERGM